MGHTDCAASIQHMGNLVDVAADFVEAGGCFRKLHGVNRRGALRTRAGAADDQSADVTAFGEARSLRFFKQDGIFVLLKACRDYMAAPPLLAAAAAALGGEQLIVVRRHEGITNDRNAAAQHRPNGAETGTVSAAAGGTGEGMQRGGAKPRPLPS